MQIAFHIGANCSDEDRLLKSTLRNVDMLSQNGIEVPAPNTYRSLIRNTIQGLDGAPPPEGTRDVLLDSFVEAEKAERIILSNGNFICIPNRIFDHGILYPQAEPKVRALRLLFPDDALSLFFTLRHPASFLQEILQRAKAEAVGDLLGIMQPLEIRWADVIRRIKAGAPDAELTVWCIEDSPLLWAQLIRRLAGVNDNTPVNGGLDAMSGLMRRAGIARLRDQLIATPPTSEVARQNVVAQYWEDFAIPESDEEEIEMPEIDTDMVAQMSANYEADLAEIAAMPGVTLLMPFS